MSPDRSAPLPQPDDSPAPGARQGGSRRDVIAGEQRETPAETLRPPAATPRMPDRPVEGAVGPPKDELHAFHLTGRPEDAGASAGRPLWPASLVPYARPSDVWRAYPLLLSSGDDVAGTDGELARPLSAVIERTLDDLRSEGQDAPLLREHLGRLSWALSRAAESRDGTVELADLIDEAAAAFREGFDRSEAGDAALRDELARVLSRLPQRETFVIFGPLTPLHLHVAAVRRERARRAAAFREEIDRLLSALDALLRADAQHGADGASPGRLSAALGTAGASFVDPGKLASNLPTYRGSERLSPERRARLEACARRLADGRDEVLQQEGVHLLHAGPLPGNLELPGVRVTERLDALDAAPVVFERRATRLVDLFRAIRLARLELAGAYEPERHDPVLARLDWQGLTAAELMLAPRVVVLESADRVSGRALASFSALLRSGRPIHVIVADCTAADPSGDTRAELGGFHAQLGYLSVAHREAFVLQSTLARPQHLASGLARMARCLRPGVAIVAVPSWTGPVAPWVQLVAAHAARSTPTMRHDPEAGTSWADRFDLAENQDPERDWPESTVSYVGAEGGDETRRIAITFADAAALDPAYRSHVHVVPPASWDDEQVELAEYLRLDEDERAYRLPYIWTIDEGGTLQRAIVSRELAFACLDRSRGWRVLQELAGTRNEYARRAADETRRRTLEEGARERDELEARLTARLEEVRAEGAKEAIERLVAVLMETGEPPAGTHAAQAVPLAAPPAAAATTGAMDAAPAALPVPEQRVEEEEEEDEIGTLDEPYIDSFLCTTCNECTNLNPRMFRYDGNKQAYLADVQAGTFADLVLAAEKCPARCIHPGAPRPGDDTATDELIARARAFA